jgi:hypothetical protein
MMQRTIVHQEQMIIRPILACINGVLRSQMIHPG